jgi:hypothetical protein
VFDATFFKFINAGTGEVPDSTHWEAGFGFPIFVVLKQYL